MPSATRTASASPPLSATRRILSKLERQHPGASTELHFHSPFELLVATILSAQCTDARVNQVTPELFLRYPDARAMARANSETLEPIVKPTGFFRTKARSLVAMASVLVERHGAEVPPRMEDLAKLPGVGRKTANVVLGHALGVPGLAVDRHVLRVANRLGVVRSNDPETVEAALCRALPPARWTVASDTLILHGRRVCKPRPLCARCRARADCDFAQGGAKQPARRHQRRTSPGKSMARPARRRR